MIELINKYLGKSAFLQSCLVSNFFDQIKFYSARPNRAFVTFNRAVTDTGHLTVHQIIYSSIKDFFRAYLLKCLNTFENLY